jgi:hypothetical protein
MVVGLAGAPKPEPDQGLGTPWLKVSGARKRSCAGRCEPNRLQPRRPDWAGCKEGEAAAPECSRRLHEDASGRSLTPQTVRDWRRT